MLCVCVLLSPGHETTATTTAAALYCISAHPVVEQQLLAELQAVMGDRAPTYDDLEHLPYLQVSHCCSNMLSRWLTWERWLWESAQCWQC